jgi:hypothetical protein
MQPGDIFGHKITAYGTLKVPLKAYKSVEDSLLETLNRLEGEAQPTLEQSLKAAGWVIERGRRKVEIGVGFAGMFSGRWYGHCVKYLEELAKSGFEGGITVEGEEDIQVEYRLSQGGVSAVASEVEFDEEDEDEPDVPPSPSP